MTSVYNLFQAYNLSRTERFLKSDECNSFRNFQHYRKRPLPFRQFCHLLANDLIVDVASPFAYDSEGSGLVFFCYIVGASQLVDRQIGFLYRVPVSVSESQRYAVMLS